MMLGFLIFVALVITFLIGSACISIHVFSSNQPGYPQEHELVRLNQEASVMPTSRQQRECRFGSMEMADCVRRFLGVTLAIVALVLFLVIAFFFVTF